MADIRSAHWAWLAQEAQRGNLDPLIAELSKPDCDAPPADVWVALRPMLADALDGQPPRRAKPKRIADRAEAEFIYLAHRAAGKGAGEAVGVIEDHYGVAHSTAYAAVSRVLQAGDRLAALPKSQGVTSDDS